MKKSFVLALAACSGGQSFFALSRNFSRCSSLLYLSMNTRSGSTVRAAVSVHGTWTFGFAASCRVPAIDCSVGAMTKAVIIIAIAYTAMLGGTCWTPIALRVIIMTITVFRKDVVVTSSIGSSDSAARNRVIDSESGWPFKTLCPVGGSPRRAVRPAPPARRCRSSGRRLE